MQDFGVLKTKYLVGEITIVKPNIWLEGLRLSGFWKMFWKEHKGSKSCSFLTFRYEFCKISFHVPKVINMGLLSTTRQLTYGFRDQLSSKLKTNDF